MPVSRSIGNNHRKLVPACLAVCLLVSTLPAQSLRDPRFLLMARRGFDGIYNLDYDQAERVFSALKKEYPQHPAPPLYLGVIAWLRELFRRQDLNLDLFLSPSFFTKAADQTMPAQQRKAFLDDIQECQRLAQELVKRNPRNTEALYFLGASYGILSSFSITIDHDLHNAFRYGNKAYDFDRRVIKLDPTCYDAYMTVGLYQYIVGSIPWYFKWLAAIAGYYGNKAEGFRDVALAVAKGEYVKTDAKILQMVLLMHEGRPKEALQEAQDLRHSYSGNYIFQVNVAQIMEVMSQTDQAVAEYLDVVRQAEERKPNYVLLPLATFRYVLGYKFFRMGRLEPAKDQFRKSLANPGTPGREKTLSQLRLAQILDLEGKRQEAVEGYQMVLKLGAVEDSHDLARKFLQNPYRR